MIFIYSYYACYWYWISMREALLFKEHCSDNHALVLLLRGVGGDSWCTTEEAVLPGLVASSVILIFRTPFRFLYFIPQLVALYTGSSKSESQGAEGGYKVEFRRHWQESHFWFDPDKSWYSYNPGYGIRETWYMYAIDTHTEYVLRLF